ncbi:indole-3-glycerol phosphate synthase TrpC [Bacteroidota bacterium]
MNILEEIIEYKRKEVEERKSLFPVKLLEKSMHLSPPAVSLKKYLQRTDKCGIIAEIKRRSPSRGIINPHVSIERTSIGYMQAGASALSILTDEKYFGGSNGDLQTARKFNFCPILRKDFIVDEYQIVEARSIGADAILLISAALSPDEVRNLAAFAKSLDLEVLMEIHNKSELEKNLCDEVDLIGVNNRNLKTFKVDLNISIELAEEIPDRFIKVSESGISNPESVLKLKKHGFQGFLIGEYFMGHNRPEQACTEFVGRIRKLETETD